MTADGELTVACIGAGYFAQFHYDAWARIPRVNLIASVDMDLDKARATGLPAYENINALFADTIPDILDVVVPPDAQAAVLRSAFGAGVKTVICQKPFCKDLDEARAITANAHRAGTDLIVHENFRFQPWYRAIKQALRAGEIGEALQATFRLRTGDGQGPQAYLARQPYFQTMPRLLIHETGIHWVDTFRFLLGEPNEVYADLRRLNPAIAGEDAGYFVFGYESGTRALFDGNRLLDHAAKNTRHTLGLCEIEGTTGTLSLDGAGEVRLRRFGETTAEVILPAQKQRGFGGDCVFALQSHVIAGLLDGQPIENTAENYLRNLEIESAIYQSDIAGKRVQL